MSFQIDYIQADAFQSLISDSPFTIPMNKQRVGTRVTAAGTILSYKCTTTGEIFTVDIWMNGTNSSATSVIFNVEVNGNPVFAGGDRPTIATGEGHVQKASVSEAVEIGDDIEITVEQCPPEGISVPIDTLVRVVVS